MKKQRNKQANYRLPETLLNDLREVAEETQMPQSLIVRTGVQEKINRLKTQIQRRKQKAELSTV